MKLNNKMTIVNNNKVLTIKKPYPANPVAVTVIRPPIIKKKL